MKKYQVIIIGSGPSGLSTAINLINNGVKDILVIEKSQFPRFKCCAGYITNQTRKSYNDLGLNIDECHYSLIENFKIYYKYKEKQIIKNKFLYTNEKIDRVELDYELYKLAKKKKIEILENSFIIEHNMNNNYIKLNDNKEFEYEKLVFADGTTGFGSKYQNLKLHKKNIAMQAIIPTDRPDSIEIHFGITKHGYAWISSYNGLTNVGFTDIYKKDINYNYIFKEMLNNNNLKCKDQDIKGCFTPIGINKPIINNNIYYVGDALGACDPFTLSGLRYSLKSGKMVAESISNNNNRYILKYSKKLKYKFIFMQLIQKIFYFKLTLNIVFNIMCKFFKNIISFFFNNVFVSKK